ncbi:hypothetical protein [Variovorax sp. PMC12]|uniref:hypothetical protein n=1 Tax=Variovorax sp. PMC12 TaxID=2126319 RepID=UPI000D131467|nr:hypothetical protein [Variovorax sp. PMC12]AVQ81674.1 hypothetical protein C4F17_12340 [Variovorax sp. PMC12]
MCLNCAAAIKQPDYPLYDAACKTCTVRAFAHGLPFWQSREAGALVPAYTQAMQAAFGTEWRVWHEKVKECSANIEKARAA